MAGLLDTAKLSRLGKMGGVLVALVTFWAITLPNLFVSLFGLSQEQFDILFFASLGAFAVWAVWYWFKGEKKPALEISLVGHQYVSDYLGYPDEPMNVGQFHKVGMAMLTGTKPPQWSFFHLIEFRVTNSGPLPTDGSRPILAIRSQIRQARLKWFWKGKDDSGKPVVKYLDELNLESGATCTILLKLKGDSDFWIPDDIGAGREMLSVPINTKLEVRLSVVGVSHERESTFFTVELPDRQTLLIEKSGSVF